MKASYSSHVMPSWKTMRCSAQVLRLQAAQVSTACSGRPSNRAPLPQPGWAHHLQQCGQSAHIYNREYGGWVLIRQMYVTYAMGSSERATL